MYYFDANGVRHKAGSVRNEFCSKTTSHWDRIFDEMIKNQYYYVDKTGMISELLRSGGKVTLFTRPRRFGKSLNMSMLKNFFFTAR